MGTQMLVIIKLTTDDQAELYAYVLDPTAGPRYERKSDDVEATLAWEDLQANIEADHADLI